MQSDQLTVFVTGENGEAHPDAEVSIEGTDAYGTTDQKGEVVLSLPADQNVVTVIVKEGDETVSAPFYLTQKGTRNLTVNFPYLQQLSLQQQAESTPPPAPPATISPAIGLIAIIAAVVIVLYLLRKKIKSPEINISRPKMPRPAPRTIREKDTEMIKPNLTEYFNKHRPQQPQA